jgi:dolichol-phosphate mannosyltransferase
MVSLIEDDVEARSVADPVAPAQRASTPRAAERVSIVIPVFNEDESIGPLLAEIAAATHDLNVIEVVVVDDGSDDGTGEAVLAQRGTVPGLRLIRHARRRGQSMALVSGIRAAEGDLVATLDGDGQNDPADLALLVAAYHHADPASTPVMVAGQRLKRQDTALRRISSRVANGARSFVLNDGVRDTGCSLKLFRRADFLALPAFDHLHRFIPALMLASGVRVVLVDVSHRPRARGTSKYGFWDRLWVGIYDLFGVRWLIRRLGPAVDAHEENS